MLIFLSLLSFAKQSHCQDPAFAFKKVIVSPRFKNRPSMTFDDAQASADQEFGLAKDLDGTLEYATK